jgi:hypothetical protein
MDGQNASSESVAVIDVKGACKGGIRQSRVVVENNVATRKSRWQDVGCRQVGGRGRRMDGLTCGCNWLEGANLVRRAFHLQKSPSDAMSLSDQVDRSQFCRLLSTFLSL